LEQSTPKTNPLFAVIRQNLKGDPVIWAVSFALAILGILTVYSSASAYAYRSFGGDTEAPLRKQLFFVTVCFILMWATHKIDYRYYAKIALIGLIISVPLLLYANFFGVKINSASRWIYLPGGITFQPSDLAKFCLIAYLSSMLAKKQSVITELKTLDDIKSVFVPMLTWCGLICGIIALNNASNAIVLFSTCMLLMLIGRVPVKYLFFLCLIGMFIGGVGLFVGNRWQTFLNRLSGKSEVAARNMEQSYIAIATGTPFGKGPGNSTQRNFLPNAFSDFIYAIIIEEYGILGGFVTILLYLILLYRGMLTVARSERAFGGLLSAGLSFALVTQAFVNMGVAVGLGPITGLPLPLVSMGGTSLLFTGISLGIILSVSKGEGEEVNE
jgi:cell division protein FtsW